MGSWAHGHTMSAWTLSKALVPGLKTSSQPTLPSQPNVIMPGNPQQGSDRQLIPGA